MIWTRKYPSEFMDNYPILVIDRFKKAELYQLNNLRNRDIWKIFKIPMPKYADVLEFRFQSEIQVYNHEVKFNKNVLVYEPYSRPGSAIIIYTNKKPKWK